MSGRGVILALSTAGSAKEAERIGRALVERKLAACVNVVPGVRSIYRWQGEVCAGEESLLVIKTTAQRWEALSSALRELHSYDVPELVRLELDGGAADYLEWVVASVSQGDHRD